MLSAILFSSICVLVQSTDPTVTIDGHKIIGIADPGGFAKYLGIPYADVDPKFPFSPSKPHPAFTQDFVANEAKSCLRIENEFIFGTIDCLTLDIYVPNAPGVLLPVMVWIKRESEFKHNEKKFAGVESFISEHPRNIKSSKASSTPIIIGYGDLPPMPAPVMYEIWISDFDMKEDSEDYRFAYDVVRQFYFEEEKVNASNLLIDYLLRYPIHRMAELLLQNGATNVYRYVFSYNGGRIIKDPLDFFIGNEINYLLDDAVFDKTTTREDKFIIDVITTLWTNFAKFGNPTPQITELTPIKWKPITKKTHPYLNIDLKVSEGSRPAHDRMTFWHMFYKLYKAYLR
ncbi:hypothetical protein PYW07_007683 [Mythimna separata]|uniref:Carboxylesterase type B domain-containing protein n=1 Tax=Mythimna separata TaxID=271217 RepID=A0AAD7YQP5_MYTSE|nr:hypothetical protein PYW07_007683 [Mythimna separata]